MSATVWCSFCGAPNTERRRIVAAYELPAPAICDRCAGQVLDVLREADLLDRFKRRLHEASGSAAEPDCG